ncbi:MAG: NTP transferase domain-containing protein, partial [Kiritimatiellia bacterium]
MNGHLHPEHPARAQRLAARVTLSDTAVVNPTAAGQYGGIDGATAVLVLLAAGKGTRFGLSPKCVQAVRGLPLARHTIDAFRRVCPAPCVTLVGYAQDEVMARLGADNVYVRSANPTGGTAWAAYEALSVPGLEAHDPLLIIAMGDRIIPQTVFQRLLRTHAAGAGEAALTLLSALYAPPAQHGKGRILRDADGRVLRILEQNDIDAIQDPVERQRLDELTEANCPLYALRARTLRRYAGALLNDNAQGQYYFTDLVEAIRKDQGEVRTVTTRATDPDYVLLCSDVTRPPDLARLESVLATCDGAGAGAPDAVL